MIPVLQSRRLIAFIDMAYQGFGDSLDGDAYRSHRQSLMHTRRTAWCDRVPVATLEERVAPRASAPGIGHALSHRAFNLLNLPSQSTIFSRRHAGVGVSASVSVDINRNRLIVCLVENTVAPPVLRALSIHVHSISSHNVT